MRAVLDALAQFFGYMLIGAGATVALLIVCRRLMYSDTPRWMR